MNEVLFPELKITNDFVFKISYEGSSFEGQINLNNLAEELSGLSDCLNKILSLASREKAIDINPFDYEFVIEPFEKGSFRKKLKLIAKGIEKHPATANTILTVVLIFVGIGQVIVSNQSNEIQKKFQDDSYLDIDKIKLELLTDKDFLAAYSKIVSPLLNSDDKVRFTQPDNIDYIIPYTDKTKFYEAVDGDVEFETQTIETLYGRITRVDLAATKNAIGFKLNDGGSTIPCSFLDSVGSEERKNLLDKWVKITGITGKVKEDRRNIIIYSYEIIKQPEQLSISF